jgi:hypothetical protein
MIMKNYHRTSLQKNTSFEYLLLALIALFSFSSCSNYNQIDFEQELMVEAYLINQRLLPDVRLSLTQPVFEFYSFEEAAYSDAQIFIDLVDENQQVLQTFDYKLKEAGIYSALNTTYIVEAGKSYNLRVLSTEGNLTASSTVPTSFNSSSPNISQVVYQGLEQFEVSVTATSTQNRQTSFIFTVIAESVSAGNLTPFYASVFNADEEEADLEEFSLISSPIINEANYETQADGTILIRLPWISIAFYGKNTIVANSLDDNLFDFVRSQSVQLGGGALAPGEIQNIINRVDGGIGIFGSITSDTSLVDVLVNAQPKPTLPF